MSEQVPNKETVEAIPAGSITVSLTKCCHPVWGDQINISKLNDAVLEVQQELIEKKRAVACQLTRLVMFTSDYNGVVGEWMKSLGRPFHPSTDENAIAFGQMLIWGDGKIETTYPIIILNEAIAVGLVGDNDSLKIFSKAILAHELGHIHDDFIQLQIFGKQGLPSDWLSIRQFIAQSTWGEYFAETVAYAYLHENNLDTQIQLAILLCKSANEKIANAIKEHRLSNNAEILFNIVTSEISKSCNQLGRVSGLISSEENEKSLGNLRDGIVDFSIEWAEIVDQIYQELNKINQTENRSTDTWTELQKLVEKLFQINGIFPKQEENKWWFTL